MRWWIPIVFSAGCAQPYAYDSCTESSQCQSAFGLASTCGSEGFCEGIELPERCGTTTPSDLFESSPLATDTILMATMYDHDSDSSELKSTNLAFNHANQSGGAGGLTIGVIHCDLRETAEYDSLTREEAGVELAEFLGIDLGVTIIVGPGASTVAEVAFRAFEAQPNGAPLMISPSATSSALTFIDGTTKTDDEPGLFWRTAAPDDLQAAVIAQDIRDKLGVTDVAVITEAGPYGDGLSSAFKTMFEDGTHTATLYSYANSGELSAQVATVGALNATDSPVVLFISSQVTESISFLNTADAIAGYENRTLYFTDGGADNRLWQESTATDFFPRIRGTRPGIPTGPQYAEFVTAYAIEYGPAQATDSAWTSHAYDAGWLAVYAAEWSLANEGTASGIGAAKGLRKISEGTAHNVGPLSLGAIAESFATGTGINITGASGSLDYASFDEETRGDVEIWHVDPTNGIEALATCAPNGTCIYDE